MRPFECDLTERFNAFIIIGGVGEVLLNDSVKRMDRKMGEERVPPLTVTLKMIGLRVPKRMDLHNFCETDWLINMMSALPIISNFVFSLPQDVKLGGYPGNFDECQTKNTIMK